MLKKFPPMLTHYITVFRHPSPHTPDFTYGRLIKQCLRIASMDSILASQPCMGTPGVSLGLRDWQDGPSMIHFFPLAHLCGIIIPQCKTMRLRARGALRRRLLSTKCRAYCCCLHLLNVERIAAACNSSFRSPVWFWIITR